MGHPAGKEIFQQLGDKLDNPDINNKSFHTKAFQILQGMRKMLESVPNRGKH
jgi:hypothetical protein